MIDFPKQNTKYTMSFTSAMRKDLKRAQKRGYDMSEISDIILTLANDEPLGEHLHDHALSGKWIGHRELHIRPDWLLIYQKKENLLILELTRTGTHADLFNL